VPWRLEFRRTAHREFARIPAPYHARIEQLIAKLPEDPFPAGSLKLQGRDERRIRVGEYRVLYEIDKAEHRVINTAIRPRGAAYR
jgi:mRNA interferase RelE/StbE